MRWESADPEGGRPRPGWSLHPIPRDWSHRGPPEEGVSLIVASGPSARGSTHLVEVGLQGWQTLGGAQPVGA